MRVSSFADSVAWTAVTGSVCGCSWSANNYLICLYNIMHSRHYNDLCLCDKAEVSIQCCYKLYQWISLVLSESCFHSPHASVMLLNIMLAVQTPCMSVSVYCVNVVNWMVTYCFYNLYAVIKICTLFLMESTCLLSIRNIIMIWIIIIFH